METWRLRFDATDSTHEASKGSIAHPNKIWLSKEVMHQAYFKLEDRKSYEAEAQPTNSKFVRWIFDLGGHLQNPRARE